MRKFWYVIFFFCFSIYHLHFIWIIICDGKVSCEIFCCKHFSKNIFDTLYIYVFLIAGATIVKYLKCIKKKMWICMILSTIYKIIKEFQDSCECHISIGEDVSISQQVWPFEHNLKGYMNAKHNHLRMEKHVDCHLGRHLVLAELPKDAILASISYINVHHALLHKNAKTFSIDGIARFYWNIGFLCRTSCRYLRYTNLLKLIANTIQCGSQM